MRTGAVRGRYRADSGAETVMLAVTDEYQLYSTLALLP
jgi:hypothetical protein